MVIDQLADEFILVTCPSVELYVSLVLTRVRVIFLQKGLDGMQECVSRDEMRKDETSQAESQKDEMDEGLLGVAKREPDGE